MRRYTKGFTWVEILITVALLGILVFLLLPSLRRNQQVAQGGRGKTVASELHRIQVAKDQYAADRKLAVGATVAMEDLIKEGYLTGGALQLPGVRFHLEAVGTPVTYTIAAPDREGKPIPAGNHTPPPFPFSTGEKPH